MTTRNPLAALTALDDLPRVEERGPQPSLVLRQWAETGTLWEALADTRERLNTRLQAAGGEAGAVFVASVDDHADGALDLSVGVLLTAPAVPFADLKPDTLAGGTFLRATYSGGAADLPAIYDGLTQLAQGLRYRRTGLPLVLFGAGPPPATLLIPVRRAEAAPSEPALAGVALTADDAGALADWYASVLGVTFAAHGPERVQVEANGATWATPRFVVAPSGRVDEQGRPPLALRFRVPDLATAMERVLAQGVVVLSRERRPDGPAALVRDPNGVFVELWEAEG